MFSVFSVQLRNRLNVQRGQLLKAHQTSLLVRRQHKDAVIQNGAELEAVTRHQPQQPAVTPHPAFASERHETQVTDVQNKHSVAHDAEVDENLSSVPPSAETHNPTDACSSQASNTRDSVVLKRNAFVRRSLDSSANNAESSGRRVTADVSRQSLRQQTASSIKRQSSLSLLRPSAVKSGSQVDACKLDYSSSSSHVPSPLTLNNCGGNSWPATCSGTASGLGRPLAYMPPLTVSVTSPHAPVLNSQPRSSQYFDGLEVSPASDSDALSGHGRSSEEMSGNNAVPLKNPNCMFASKCVIANTYLSRRPPVYSPVHLGTQSDAVDGQSTDDNHVDNSSAQLNHSATTHTAACHLSPPAMLSSVKQPSAAELSVTTAASPLVPPRSSSNTIGRQLSRSSLPDLHKASLLSSNRQILQTAVPADVTNGMRRSSSADSSDNVCAASLLTHAVTTLSSLPAVFTCMSSFVPFHTWPVSRVSLASLSSSLCSPVVPVNADHSPALPSSDLSAAFSSDSTSERPQSEITDSDNTTAHVMSQVSASVSDVAVSFPDSLSSSRAVSRSSTGALLSTHLITVSASSEITSISQTVASEKQPSNISAEILSVPLVCNTMPCTLTISTHAPVSSPNIDNTALLHTSSSAVVSNTSVIAGSSLSEPCTATTAVDIPDSSSHSLSHVVPSSKVSCEHTNAPGDHHSPRYIPNSPGAQLLYTSSPRMTRRRMSSDGAHASRLSPPSHAAVQKNASESLAQTNITAVLDKTAEEPASEAEKSAADAAADATESSEVEEGASSDDASSDVVPLEGEPDPVPVVQTLVRKRKQKDGSKTLQRVSFSPLALLLDAALEGDLELVMNTAKKVLWLSFKLLFGLMYSANKSLIRVHSVILCTCILLFYIFNYWYYFLLHFTKRHSVCLLYTSPSPRDGLLSRMPSSA